MAAICVRGLPEEAKQLLRLRAAGNGRSMEAELRHILIRALLRDGPPMDSPAAEPPMDSPAAEPPMDSPPQGGYSDGPKPEP